MSKKTVTISIIASLGVLTGTILLATRSKAAPADVPEFILTVDDILASQTMGELSIYYMSIGQLYFTGQINKETYETLYQAYVTRFYELTGAV